MDNILEKVRGYLSAKTAEHKILAEEEKRIGRNAKRAEAYEAMSKLYADLLDELNAKCFAENEQLSEDARAEIASQILNKSYDEFRKIREKTLTREA